MPVRFQAGGAYRSDIASLRDQIRANGTNPNLAVVPLRHPGAPAVQNLSMHINLAYQANGNLALVNGSLYAVAFTNPNGTWHFTVGAIGVALPGAPFPGGNTGSYANLGYPAGPLPAISIANLAQALQDVNAYAGGPLPAGHVVLDGMTRLIVAVNEAIRLNSVETGIDDILNNRPVPAPNWWNEVHSWNGHSLGG